MFKIEGKHVLEYIYERVNSFISADKIAIATSTEQNDNIIAEFCSERGWNCFRGSKEDVSLRLLECSNNYDFRYFIRVCGDNVFIDPQLIIAGLSLLEGQRYDLVSNLDKRTFPYGQSIEIVNTEFYSAQYCKFESTAHKEHVTKYFYDHPDSGDFCFFYNDICPESAGMRLVLDTREDYNFLSGIASLMDKSHLKYGLKDLYLLSKTISGDNKKIE